MTPQANPLELTTSVLEAVADGAWAPVDVAATVTAHVRTDRSHVLATLWDLVEEGTLVYDRHAPSPGFRMSGR